MKTLLLQITLLTSIFFQTQIPFAKAKEESTIFTNPTHQPSGIRISFLSVEDGVCKYLFDDKTAKAVHDSMKKAYIISSQEDPMRPPGIRGAQGWFSYKIKEEALVLDEVGLVDRQKRSPVIGTITCLKIIPEAPAPETSPSEEPLMK